VFVLKERAPGLHVTGYPYTPTGFLVMTVVLMALLAINNPLQAALGPAIVAAGLPVYRRVRGRVGAGARLLERIDMTWIRVVPFDADEELQRAREAQKKLYPIEYAHPTHPQHAETEGIVASHSLIPDALYHAFAAFGAMMAPDLPLSRRQHEMITTVVSALNRCKY